MLCNFLIFLPGNKENIGCVLCKIIGFQVRFQCHGLLGYAFENGSCHFTSRRVPVMRFTNHNYTSVKRVIGRKVTAKET